MSGRFGSRVCRGLALIWSATTITYLFVVSMVVIRDASFRLNIGVIKATGRAALWPILLPAVIGLVGFVLVLKRSKWGAWPRTICITTPWIGRLLLLTLATCFFLAALWIYLNTRMRPSHSAAVLNAHAQVDGGDAPQNTNLPKSGDLI